jgi:NitT/TauT family transport system substrate-binding protein
MIPRSTAGDRRTDGTEPHGDWSIRMKSLSRTNLWIVCCLLAALLLPAVVSAKKTEKIRFGTLPVLQALPLYVARDRGLFGKHGVAMELIPFNTAAEKDIALSAGSLDGVFADLVTPIVLRGNGRDVLFTAVNYTTSGDRRMFAVLGKPGGPYKTVKDLAKAPVAVSSNSVIDFVTERLLTSGGVAEKDVATIESKNIGLRLQMLLTGQVEAATLPEPLVSVALAKGAVLLADDKGLPESLTVLVFSGPFIRKHGKAVKGFLAAVNEAAMIINKDPDGVRSVMVKHVRLPAPMRATFPVPRFPKLHAPDKAALRTIAEWLKKRGVVDRVIGYEEVVDARYLP